MTSTRSSLKLGLEPGGLHVRNVVSARLSITNAAHRHNGCHIQRETKPLRLANRYVDSQLGHTVATNDVHVTLQPGGDGFEEAYAPTLASPFHVE